MAFWAGARILRRGLTRRDGLLLGLVTALAVLTKGTSYALVPGVLLVLGVALRRGAARADALVSLGALGVPVIAWLAYAHLAGRPAVNTVGGGAGHPHAGLGRFFNYVVDYYLPHIPGIAPFPLLVHNPVYQVWIKEGWGAFGWLETRLPNWTYLALAVVTVAVIALAVLAGVRRRSRPVAWLAAFFALVGLVLLAGLHWVDYRTQVETLAPFMQGRYILPLIPLWGVAVAAALSLLPRARRATGAAVVLGAAVALQFGSLAAVLSRFYA